MVKDTLSAALLLSSSAVAPQAVSGAPLSFLGASSQDRRQLELCLVAVQRVVYWAELVSIRLAPEARLLDRTTPRINNNDFVAGSADASHLPPEEQTTPVPESYLRAAYLDARLGAKAILTSQVGGGASYFAYTLAGLQVPGCLDDLESYNPQIQQLKVDFRESLATLVEFDGMDSVLDRSPRSSLTMSQYDDAKRAFCARVLRERVVPLGQRLLGKFSPEALDRARTYISSYYPSEVPAPG
jgi:hypothetical protein